jgi:hypothetical protein
MTMTTKPRFVGRGGRKGSWLEGVVVAGRVVGTGHPRLPQKAVTGRQRCSRKAGTGLGTGLQKSSTKAGTGR